jgi:hypothetical protein
MLSNKGTRIGLIASYQQPQARGGPHVSSDLPQSTLPLPGQKLGEAEKHSKLLRKSLMGKSGCGINFASKTGSPGILYSNPTNPLIPLIMVNHSTEKRLLLP